MNNFMTMEVEEAFNVDLKEQRGYTDSKEIKKEWERVGDRLLSALWDEYSLTLEKLNLKDYKDN